MPTYLHPGVYVEEIPSGSKPIEGVGTSTAAFVGYTTKGPIGEPNLIFKWDDYVKEYGGIRDLKKQKIGDPMGLSVAAFFQNGGGKAYIVRIAKGKTAKKAAGYLDHPEDIGKKALKFTAINEGEWANKIIIEINKSKIDDDDGENLYDITITEEQVDEFNNKTFDVKESFQSVSLNPDKPLFISNVIDGDSNFVTVEPVGNVTGLSIFSDRYLGASTSGDLKDISFDFSNSTDPKRKLKIKLDGKGVKSITLDKKNYAVLAEVAKNLQEKVRSLAQSDSDKWYTGFTCEAKNNKLILISGTRNSKSSVEVIHDFSIAPTLKLGLDAVLLYTGTSRSAGLTGLNLNLTDQTVFVDDDSRSLSGTIDGVAFKHIFSRIDPFNLNAAQNDINHATTGIAGVECTIVDANFLQLTSKTHKSTSAVVINSESGIAPVLKLGVTPRNLHGAEEITGQEGYENSLLIGTSASGGLDNTQSLDLSAEANAGARSLNISIDGGILVAHDLGQVNLATLEDIRAGIDAIDGLTCTLSPIAGSNPPESHLALTSDSNRLESAVVISPLDPIAIALKLGTGNEGEEVSGRQNRDSNFRTQLTGQENADVSTPEDKLDGGSNGNPPEVGDYDNVFTQFVKYRDINIMCLPGQYWSIDGSGNSVSIIQKAIAHAEKMKSRMVIVDPPPNHELVDATKVKAMGLPSQTYCVVYYPWVEAANKFYNAERNPGMPKTVLVPSSGYAAGMWAKTDGKRGVWKAPAGMGTGLLGVSKLEFLVEDDEQDSLNPWGVNCLRSMPGAGKVIWGARTRATKADPEWRYVPVRRTAIMIEQSIYEGIQWAVFEPNDHRLWSALRGNISGFMNGLFRVGAFQGEKASDAYFVRCGLGDTMTQAEIDAGQVIVIVGFAPLKPAEFVIVRIQQKVNQQ